jgi:hypothetical protein
MEIANLEAITFNTDNRQHIRVYYQTKDRKLRETSYESSNGWFVRGGNIIAENAIANSPITAARWNDGNTTQVRNLNLSFSILLIENRLT